MKTKLTTEQSKHLIELGVPEEKATRVEFYGAYKTNPIFTLTDLLDILPKEIEPKNGNACLEIQMFNDTCCVSYEYTGHGGCKAYFDADELIDALYELVVWCIENSHLKFV